MAMKCPECGKLAHVRSSGYLSPTVKLIYYQCQNLYCSCTFNTMESLNRVLCKMAREVDEPETQPVPKLPQNLGRYGDSFKLKDRHQQP
ncbi:ogr/Delta-like zinc finger family protein [Buttiauxella noackiae]|uniref:ogr/Delta-like zinc finger family protein n=1 Tax=Buttiauxella noackiae TaxID=82992 RepID=UPI0009078DD3|nr:ogr/Delta-like zinc finger family protein [Buttiauxella noackiae]